MRHGSKKIKVRLGIDANKMLMRKLTMNFISMGKITTTQTKAKLLKTFVERLVEKTKQETEANKNYLLRYIPYSHIVQKLFLNVGPAMKDKIGGYVTLQKMYQRDSDGAIMVKMQWSNPVVMNEPVKEKVSVKDKVEPKAKTVKKASK